MNRCWTRTWLFLTATLLPACTECEPLDRVEVGGPEGIKRTVLENTLADFSSWTDLPICVSEIRVGEVAGDRAKYNPVNRAVVLDPDRSRPRDAALHELCHAADVQFDLSTGRAEAYEAEGTHGLTPRRRTQEGFARICSVGAVTLALATEQSCPDDAAVDGLWSHTRDLVYTGDDPIGRAHVVPVASWKTPFPAEHDLRLWTCAPDQSGHLSIAIEDETTGDYVSQRLDLTTGAALEGVTVRESTTWDESVGAPPGWGSFAAKSDEQGIVMWAQLLADDTPRVTRLLAEEDGRWSLVETCFTEQECLFDMEGSVYRGYEQDGTVYWGRVERL